MRKRILVGLVLLAICVGGAVALAQGTGPFDALAARIGELQQVYQVTVTQISNLEAELADLKAQKFRLEGGIMELQRYQAEITPVTPTDASVKPSPETEP